MKTFAKKIFSFTVFNLVEFDYSKRKESDKLVNVLSSQFSQPSKSWNSTNYVHFIFN